MSQAGRTRHFARSARRGEEKNEALFFSSPRLSFLFPSRSPRLAHKAPVMQAKVYTLLCLSHNKPTRTQPLSI